MHLNINNTFLMFKRIRLNDIPVHLLPTENSARDVILLNSKNLGLSGEMCLDLHETQIRMIVNKEYLGLFQVLQ